MRFRAYSLEFGVQGSGFRIQGSGIRVRGIGFRIQGSGFRVQGSEFRVQGSGYLGSRLNLLILRVQLPGLHHVHLHSGAERVC